MLASCTLSLGCATIGGRAAKSAVRESAAQLSTQETTQDLTRFLSDPQLRQAIVELTQAVVGASVDDLTTEQRTQRISDALAKYAQRLTAVVGAEIGDAMARAIPRATEAFLATMASPQGQARISAIGGTITGTVVASLADQLSKDSAVGDAIRDDLGRGTAEALDVHLTPALGRAARTISREGVIGAEEGFEQVQKRPNSVMGGATRAATAGLNLFRLLAIIFGGVALVLAVLFVRGLIIRRKERAESQAREAALLLVTSVIKAAEGRPWAGELRDLLRDEMRDTTGGAYVRKVLQEHPDLRMRVGHMGAAPA
jgi:hypothetical protein